jgi:signal transduction histidine kinase
MTLAGRLALGTLLLVALMAGLAAHLLLTIRDLHQGQAELDAHHLEAVNLRSGLRRDLESIREFTRKLFALSDRDYAEALDGLRRSTRGNLEGLVRLERSPDVRAAIGAFAERWRGYLQEAQPAERAALASAEPVDPGALIGRLDEVLAALEEVDRTAQRAAEAQLAASAANSSRAREVAGVATGGALLAALTGVLILARSVLGPIRQLARGASEVADGNFAYNVPETGGPELSTLAREFNTMAQRLAELDHLKRDFLSSVSHDLKAPLASMQETSRLLLDGTVDPPTAGQERLLHLQLECGDRLSAMIEDLLELARLEAGAVNYEIEPVDLGELAAAVIREASGLLAAKGLEVEGPATAERLLARADRPHLARAVWNLLSNAARFTPRGGRLGIDVVRPENSRIPRSRGREVSWAALSVWDSGPGVPDADKEKIFGRFYRGRGGGGAPHGTGLGLAIARRVARDHCGDLWVEDRPGGGADFVLALPLARLEERA